MSHTSILNGQLWQNHERRVLCIFKRALELLQDDPDLDACEDELNRKLLFCVREANAELGSRNEGLEWPVVYEANNQPDLADETRAAREDKRPDFQWGVTDHTESDPRRQDKFFVIECKRLGKPTSSSWVFNRNYVQHGILRFVNKDHGYGKSAPSGAMVGYIRDMGADQVLTEVNQHATTTGLNELDLSNNGWNAGGASRLDNVLDRLDVSPSPFKLRHLWVDLSDWNP